MRYFDLHFSPTSGDEGSMVTAPIYHNVGGDYPRRPPPPVPGVSEDAPPALPPRCFNSSKSESFLLARMDPSQHEGLKDSYSQDTGVPSSSRGWEGGGTGTLKEDAYAQQLRRQARRFSEQHKPVGISMQVVSTKSTVQVSLSQSYKQEQASAMEVKPVMRVSPQTSPCHTEVNTATILLQSPPASRGRTTPEPPPMPTPMKNGEVEVPSDLNKTADFPPPLQEFVKGAETSKDDSDRCADDSYGYYKTQSPREVGKYKRTTSDTSLLHTRQEIKTFQLHPDLDRKDVADMPNKPPRKKLEGRDSPNLALISKSPSVLNGDRKATDQRVPPVNSSLQPAEVTSVQHAVKSVANPLSNMSLQNSNSPTGISSSSGNFVDTVVQRPRDRNSLTEEPREPRQSVKDRVKNIEVFSHSPGSSKGGSQHSPNNGPGQAFCDDNRDSSFDSYTSDSLEQLESSAIQSDNLKDRLRPVVKKGETSSVQPESLNINKENTLVHSVQGGQKRNYQKSFSPRTRSGSSSGNSDHQNVATFHNRSHSDKQQGGTTSPQRQDHKRNHHHSEQRHSHDLRLPQGHSKNSPSSQSVQHKTSDQSPSDNHNSQRHDKSKSMNNKRNINDPSYQIHHHTDNKDDQNKRISPHTTLHSEVVKEHHSAAPHATPEVVVNHGRQPSAEELECDQKAQELAKVLQDSDKELSEVLQVDSKKNRMQFLDGILPVEPTGEERRPRSASKKEEKSSEGGSEETEKEPTSPMPSNYYVSPPKAMIELEIRKLSDNNHLVHDIADNDTLAQKKEELLQRMVKKVDVLKEDKKELLTDIDENEALGKQDIDKIIRLLLKLSGLLARAENTIQGLSENTNEKIRKMTYDKRDRLYSQHEDAKQLKHDIDRRSEQVEMILQSCLATNELDDYHYYIKMKSKYTIQLQELEDKITLGNEQIVALQKSIPNKK
ncbi:SHRM3-like protein [Mya arenaria]|uniref:SHRM3-like protein n=1 Tax=Mya arenaria TaxID=6604 RepID=A0ABY7DR64_MYAAR|nr:SHRM3-like protein [Mya arenaria]